MTNPHFAYLRYVLLHKWYVLRAGLVIGGYSIPWIWRLLVHDLSKFSAAEWGPYVRWFYGFRAAGQTSMLATQQREFNAAWLHHIHANPHHWQHWILTEDGGRTLVLVPPNAVVNEMVADWIAAGQKILNKPDMAACVAETLAWYVHNAGEKMQLRRDVRTHVEQVLHALATRYRLDEWAGVMHRQAMTRRSLSLG